MRYKMIGPKMAPPIDWNMAVVHPPMHPNEIIRQKFSTAITRNIQNPIFFQFKSIIADTVFTIPIHPKAIMAYE